jgi:hypothetical protein
VNERNADGLTPLHFIAREGHYKYPPTGIPLALVQAGADLEAKDAAGRTALEVALLSGWQVRGWSKGGGAGGRGALACCFGYALAPFATRTSAPLQDKNTNPYFPAPNQTKNQKKQNIAELLLKSQAQTAGVAAVKGAVTCPDCKRIIAQYNL